MRPRGSRLEVLRLCCVWLALGPASGSLDRGPSVDIGPESLRVERVLDPSYVSSQHFVVSYFTSGPDSLFHSEVPTALLEDLEYAYRVLSTDPRAGMHVPSGRYDAGAGVRKILARVEEVEPGYSGMAYYSWPSTAPDPACSTSADGSMSVSRRVRTRGDVKRIAAHELMHLFQAAMNPWHPAWVKESTANWAVGFVFPEVARLVDSFPSLAFHATSLWDRRASKVYSPHFWDFLDLRLRDSIPPKFWARACEQPWQPALEQTLGDYGVELSGMIHEYAVWNYYTGERNDGAHYLRPELPEIRPDASFTHYPVIEAGLDSNYAQEAASNYVFFDGAASRENLRVRLHGGSAWKMYRKITWIGTTGGNRHVPFSPRDSSSEEFLVPQWWQYDRLAVIVTNGVNDGTIPPVGLRYDVSASEEGRPVSDRPWRPSSRPLRVSNPSKGGAAIRYRSPGETHQTDISIYDVRGRFVKRLVHQVLPAGEFNASWDGSDESGRRTASGDYVVVLRDGRHTYENRFVLVR